REDPVIGPTPVRSQYRVYSTRFPTTTPPDLRRRRPLCPNLTLPPSAPYDGPLTDVPQSYAQPGKPMAGGDDAIRALREALRLSRESPPLRQPLAESLLGLGRPDEAEAEYREALKRAPDDATLKAGLANAYYQQGKHSHALVLIEDLLKGR